MKKEKIIAYHPMSAFGGIVILDFKNGPDDKVRTGFYRAGEITGKGWSKVYCHNSEESYFKKGGNRYYIHEFIANNERGGN